MDLFLFPACTVTNHLLLIDVARNQVITYSEPRSPTYIEPRRIGNRMDDCFKKVMRGTRNVVSKHKEFFIDTAGLVVSVYHRVCNPDPGAWVRKYWVWSCGM